MPSELKSLLPTVKPPTGGGPVKRTASAEAARTGLERLRGLFEQGLVSKPLYDQKQSELVDLAVLGSPELAAAERAVSRVENWAHDGSGGSGATMPGQTPASPLAKQKLNFCSGSSSGGSEELVHNVVKRTGSSVAMAEEVRERLLQKIFDGRSNVRGGME